MDHARLEHKYQQIVKKLRLLIDKQDVEREEMILLAEENVNLKAQLTEQNEHLKSFQNHEKISKKSSFQRILKYVIWLKRELNGLSNGVVSFFTKLEIFWAIK